VADKLDIAQKSRRDDRAITMTEAMPSEPTQRDQAIIAAYRAGHSLREIARDLEIHHSVVRHVLHRHDEPCRAAGRPGKPPTPEITARDAAVISAYRDRRSMHAVSRALGLSVSVVWRILARHGVPRHPRPEPRDPAPIIAGYRAGQTLAELGDALGISTARVRQILKRHGSPARGKLINMPPPEAERLAALARKLMTEDDPDAIRAGLTEIADALDAVAGNGTVAADAG
jgi:transposase